MVHTSTTASANADQSLGTLAVQIPGATALFRKLKLDFCCGGHQSLKEACAARGISTSDVIESLLALESTPELPKILEAAELIDYVLKRFHAVHRQQLPELIRMARRVEAVHREHPMLAKGLADHLEKMQDELLAHMEKEEQILFPMLKAGINPMLVHPIGMMRHEHINHGAQLEKLSNLTSNHQAPEGACNTWMALYAGTARLAEDLIEHIHTENNLLFPQFETLASSSH
ncbi:MAG: iron-sulfur cluster repair protein YtfE [Burkholderiales bacterium]|nr:iron-sulfur cluster repair protein YtfE [Burkholderiales bacterium]